MLEGLCNHFVEWALAFLRSFGGFSDPAHLDLAMTLWAQALQALQNNHRRANLNQILSHAGSIGPRIVLICSVNLFLVASQHSSREAAEG
jgi:hypothetical protein